MPQPHSQTVTIAASAALSDAFYFGGYEFLQIHMPSTGNWTAASIGFQASTEQGGTFLPLYDDAGSLLEVSAVVDQAFSAPPEIAGALWLKLWSETGGSGVNQAAAREITITMW